MMFALLVNVAQQHRQLGLPERECAIPRLPGKPPERVILIFHPSRRRLLDLLQQFAHSQCTRQRAGDMNVIVGAPDTVCFAAQRTARSGQVSVEAWSNRLFNPTLTFFRAEHNVEQYLGQRLGQCLLPQCLAPAGLNLGITTIPGRCPGLACYAPFGALCCLTADNQILRCVVLMSGIANRYTRYQLIFQ
jgi:hypothetical protein